MATVDPVTGDVTPVGVGTCNIIFTINGGCNATPSAQQSLTVIPDAAVASVSGTTPLCIGVTATYTASGIVLGGGTGAWSSSNIAVATVDPLTGVVTAVGAGTCNIIFTITGGCNGTPSAQQSLTVTPDAAVASVTGTTPLCLGATGNLYCQWSRPRWRYRRMEQRQHWRCHRRRCYRISYSSRSR